MAPLDISLSTPVNIPLERSLYIGNMIRGILYGVEIFTFLAAVYCIHHRPSSYRKSQIFYIVHGGILLALVTIEVAVDAMWGQFMWIEHRNYPGGPLEFLADSQFSWSFILAFASNAAANILSDGLLVYRCYIIWGPRRYILALPVLTYVASSVLAIITVVESALPYTSSLLNGNIARVAVPWVSLSVALNVIVTSMICLRLLRMRALARETRSPEMSSMYTSVVAMLIESAAPISILGTGLIIVAAQNGPLISSFAYVWTVFCTLSPQVIILRVAMGRGWLKQTAGEINTTLVFAKSAAIHEQSQGVHRTIYNTEEPISGSETPMNKLDTSIKEQMSITNVV